MKLGLMMHVGALALMSAGLCSVAAADAPDGAGGSGGGGAPPDAPPSSEAGLEARFAEMEARIEAAEKRAEAAEERAAAAERKAGRKKGEAQPEHMVKAEVAPRTEAQILGDGIFSHLSNLKNSRQGNGDADDRLAGLFKTTTEKVRAAAKAHWGLVVDGTAIRLA